MFRLNFACGCSTGKKRKNNEDNLFFNGKCLAVENSGLEQVLFWTGVARPGLICAIFDGMGGEAFGEVASHAAAYKLQSIAKKQSFFLSSGEKVMSRIADELNRAVYAAKQKLCTEHMGTTMVALLYTSRHIFFCNIGDSRAYLLRDGVLQQLSFDHVATRPGQNNEKAPLIQYLGMDPEEVEVEPFIVKNTIKKGDLYLICSDGLTDMLSDLEISDIMLSSDDESSCVQRLVDAALEQGGRDNISVIVNIVR